MALQLFFGEDPSSSATFPVPSTPNSASAEAAFLSNLVGVRIEDFEAVATGPVVSLPIAFGSITATIAPATSAAITAVTPGTTNGFGRYSIPSASSSRYFEGSNFTITFSADIRAFGFWGVDIGDFGGRIGITLKNSGGATIRVITPPTTIGASGSTDGSVMYQAFIVDAGEAFRSVSFANPTITDVFAFDRFTIADDSQLVGGAPPPAPSPFTGAVKPVLPTSRIALVLMDLAGARGP